MLNLYDTNLGSFLKEQLLQITIFVWLDDSLLIFNIRIINGAMDQVSTEAIGKDKEYTLSHKFRVQKHRHLKFGFDSLTSGLKFRSTLGNFIRLLEVARQLLVYQEIYWCGPQSTSGKNAWKIKYFYLRSIFFRYFW